VDAADALCSAAFARATGSDAGDPLVGSGLALVAVGGYGRRELAPHSDLDVVLAHTDEVDVDTVAGEVFYPMWNAGANVDHAVRSLTQTLQTAGQDLRVALGMLDARHVAGDPSVTLRLRTTLLAQWRRDARTRVPELRGLVDRRVARLGELAHATVPDLKESGGGLRDATVLNALVATWLVDVPHSDLERARRALLDLRDVVHEVAGRASDRIGPDMWDDLATALGDPDAATTQRRVRELGRRVTHLSRLTWRRLEGALEPPLRATPVGPRRPGPAAVGIGHGLAVAAGEVVVERSATVRPSSTLLLRAAAEAAERGLVLSPPTTARLLREAPALPEPWPEEARELLVRLLAAGPGLLPVWETLEETGALERLLPEWERVRLLPHASLVHRFTVDRHLVETCVEAARLIRQVARPDLLLVGALLHDLGKGGLGDHSVTGAPLAAAAATRLGFTDADAATVAALVRRHLLLPEVATTRDLEDPATVEHVAERVRDLPTLELLAALTEADARATSTKAWTPWRAALVADLVARVRAHLEGAVEPGERPVTAAVGETSPDERHVSRVDVRVERTQHGSEVTVLAPDRRGLLAAVAGALTLLRIPVRAARAWTEGTVAVSRWDVAEEHLEAALLRAEVEAVLEGRRRPGEPRSATRSALAPAVLVRPEASRRATVLEVRVDDRPGVVHLVAQALSDIRVAVRSAHVTTVGPQAVDVFYLQEEAAGALADDRSAEAAHAVRAALTDPVTLDV
jgi:[protein-PII] uridylyltransferase